MNDIVEQIRRVREELIKRYGGIDGYFKHCQAQERARTPRPSARHRKHPAHTTRKASKAR